ncbi:Aldo/keto reductase [Wolfiporia cocos MD-104 SS10]|uniref:Aldo/keto reductase n=1 Tax=Wolfiporia cocos (strain MD-104) TaxID=742152 RepID=A0A2H3JHR6_WOLCO|nr:Aldo/keto reductase [Wolfiporia cocos MD-104 SS10]
MSPSTYPTRQLGRNGPTVSAIGFGAMGIGAFYGKTDMAEAYKTLTYAADRGMTFWDTADLYGTSEVTIGKWFAETGRRSEIFLATKWGARDMTPGSADPNKPNSKPSYIRGQLEKSLRDLQTDWIDLYYQHRVDPEVPIEVVMETLRPYIEKGTVRYVGLSECSVEHLRRARSVPGIGEKVIACQMEYSPFELEIETTGFVAAARELGASVVAYSPLGRGMITGRFKSRADFDADDYRNYAPRFSDENFPKNLALVDKFRTVAQKYNSTPGQIALTWILATHSDFVPIPGTRTVERLEENARAAEIQLKEDDLRELRAAIEAADVQGTRYAPQYLSTMKIDSIPSNEWKGE